MEEILRKYIDLEYKKFSCKLFSFPVKMLGVRIPQIKKLAKDFPFTEELLTRKYTYMEEKMLLLFCVARQKENRLSLLEKSIKYIDNWSLADSFCSAFQINKKKQEMFLPWILENMYSKEEYRARVAIVLLQKYYLEDKYIDMCIEKLSSVNSEKYYVQMAVSWTLQKAHSMYPEKVNKLIAKNILPPFVQNKTISKITDSLREKKKARE